MKSKIAPGTPKNTTVVYVADGGRIKVIVDGVDKDGTPTHNEWTGMFDGKDYPLVGDPMNDSRGYKTIDANTVELWNKKGGKVMVTGTIVIAPDGKSRTLTTKSKGADGKESSASRCTTSSSDVKQPRSRASIGRGRWLIVVHGPVASED